MLVMLSDESKPKAPPAQNPGDEISLWERVIASIWFALFLVALSLIGVLITWRSR